MSRRVAITGCGALTALGDNVDTIWDAILSQRLGYEHHTFVNPHIRARFFSFLRDNPERYSGLNKSIMRCLSRHAKLAVVAAREAIEQAFGNFENLKNCYNDFERGVILGSGWFGLDDSNQIRDEFRDTAMGRPMGSLISMPSAASAACSLIWNLRGYQNTVADACASGTIAIGDAFETIRSGRASMMIAGGSESLRDETNIWSIDVLQALSKEQNVRERACCPFDVRRSGFVLAEGSAVVCLEDWDRAVDRGATILAEVLGYGSYSDARDFTAPAVDLESRVRTITYAMDQAGITTCDLDYINAHGTSTQLNDANEAQAIRAALGFGVDDIPVSSTKSYTGHLIGAAGSMETIFCIKSLNSGVLPATANLLEPDSRCELNHIIGPHLQKQKVERIMNLSYGFGGTNAAIILGNAGF